MILAPLVRGRKGEHKDVFETIRKAGFLRARVDGQIVTWAMRLDWWPRRRTTSKR